VTRISAASIATLAGDLRPEWANETTFQADVVKLARECGWGITVKAAKDVADQAAAYGVEAPPIDGLIYHARYSLGSDPGWPDLFLARRRDRRVRIRELKTDKGIVSRRQAEVLDLLAACGLDVDVWRPRDWDRIREELA